MSTPSPSYFFFKLVAAILLVTIVAGLYIYSNFVTPTKVDRPQVFSSSIRLTPSQDRPSFNFPSWLPHDQGKVTYLNFWAHWCRPCIIEMPILSKIGDKLHAKGLDLILINIDTEKSEIKKAKTLFESQAANLVGIFAEEDSPSYASGLGILPFHQIIDRQGRLAAQFIGGIESGDRHLTNLLVQLLAESAAPASAQ